jgi:hypothetical protein
MSYIRATRWTVTDWDAIDQRRYMSFTDKTIGNTNGRLHEFALPKRASHKRTSTLILILINLGPVRSHV